MFRKNEIVVNNGKYIILSPPSSSRARLGRLIEEGGSQKLDEASRNLDPFESKIF